MSRPDRTSAPSPDGSRLIDVGGYRLWARVSEGGSPTVVFESGGGDSSDVWSDVAAEVRRRRPVTTVLYDRAGLGRSERKAGPYRIDDEVDALRHLLTAVGVTGDVLFVAHSYGGFVSLRAAATDARVRGVLLVDGNVPGFFDEAEVDRLLQRFAQFEDAMRRTSPEIAEVMIPLIRALPETAATMRGTRLPLSLPVIDLLAEHTWVESPDEVDAMRRAHTAFVAESPHREMALAPGTGHYIMNDRPEVVVGATERLIDQIGTRS